MKHSELIGFLDDLYEKLKSVKGAKGRRPTMFVEKYTDKKSYCELSNGIMKFQRCTKIIGYLMEDQSKFLNKICTHLIDF